MRMPAISHVNDFRWNAKIHPRKKRLLAWGGGGGGRYKACYNLHLEPWFQRLFLIFLRLRKNEHLPASLTIRSRRFASFQHLSNISVIMYETVSPWYIFLHPHNCEINAAFLEPFSFFQLRVQKCSTLCWYSRIPTSGTLESWAGLFKEG